ncbi:dnaJ homolog subfamily C member 12 isoform X2 [Amia ocellicauda]|uniref:dnaJ homolog subfamily C member 12 isoform X2 n=1 Tax=Amia ocellicauda TaxID=2972642 RepID=UPI003464461F
MDALLNCKTEDLEDYYGLLGCDELSSSEQILAEFKVRALECHPDKHPENPKAVESFQKLQEAKETLANEDSRARYDYWRRSRMSIRFRDWEALSDSVKTSMHWAVKAKKEPMLEGPEDKPGVPLVERGPLVGEESGSKAWQEGLSQDKALRNEGPQSPDTPTSPSENYWHLRFRWSADTPSDLLRKFRNYEI